MKVEFCDSWYNVKIVLPLVNRDTKCLNKLRRDEKHVVVYDKKSPSKRSHILLRLVEKFGTPLGEHSWAGYSTGSRMMLPGRRTREHRVYLVPDKVLAITKKLEEIASDRAVPWDIAERCCSLEDFEELLNNLENEVLSKRIAKTIKP